MHDDAHTLGMDYPDKCITCLEAKLDAARADADRLADALGHAVEGDCERCEYRGGCKKYHEALAAHEDLKK